jgi:hypothetical protein
MAYHAPMSDAIVDAAHAFLRAHSTGELRFDEHLRPIKYVIAPSGRLVAPVMVAMLQSVDTVLFVPECAEGAMEVQVTLVQFDEHSAGGALADRWRIHHGDPPDVRWAFLDIDAARYEGAVIDGEALVRPNPLAEDEPGLCREMNKDHADDLRRLCRHFAHINVEEPVMVAIDPLGIDVRGMFDVIRVPATEPMPTAEDARRVIQAMAEAASAAGSAD